MTQKQAGLEAAGEALSEGARLTFHFRCKFRRVAKLRPERGGMAVENSFAAARLVDFIQQGFARFGLSRKGAQKVEVLDVAAALQDRVDRRLAVEARHRTVLDKTRAADALHRLIGVAGRALAEKLAERDGGAKTASVVSSLASSARATRNASASARARARAASRARSARVFCISG
ncbi:hypothetical protein M2323_004008 [Rhodoblastus acidophilus]|nr:hypothetical protein [Rhodoblastus acidophilus]MCW2335064.1 hypothetical protein [Rhodoblastus acidophilus]